MWNNSSPSRTTNKNSERVFSSMRMRNTIDSIPETAPASVDHEDDLYRELCRRRKGLAAIQQCQSNTAWHPELNRFWRSIAAQEFLIIQKLEELLAMEFKKNRL